MAEEYRRAPMQAVAERLGRAVRFRSPREGKPGNVRWSTWLTGSFALLTVGAVMLVADGVLVGVVLLATGASLLVIAQQAGRRDPYPDRGAPRGTSPTGERGRKTRSLT